MITPGQRSLPLSVHNRFVITFTNTVFHINWLRRFSDASRLHCSNKQPSNATRFWVRHNLTDSHQCSCCQRSATMFAVFLHCTAVLCVVVKSHSQPSLSGTGVLWVSTGTHRCVDPPRQGGGSTTRQLVRCVVCGCRAK